MVRITLLLSAIYLAAIGLALLVVPVRFGVGAVPPDASPELVSLLRLLGGPLVGIAVLNWLSRKRVQPELLGPVILANLAGFGLVAANDIWGVASGEAREIARIFVVIHLAFAAAFGRAAWKLRKEGND